MTTSWRGASSHEYLTSSFLDNGVHQFDQIGLLVCFLVHLSKVLYCVVDEVFLFLAVIVGKIEASEIFLYVVFAFGFDVRLVK